MCGQPAVGKHSPRGSGLDALQTDAGSTTRPDRTRFCGSSAVPCTNVCRHTGHGSGRAFLCLA